MLAGKERSLSAAELARDAGTTEDRIRRFVELGILEPSDGVFRPADIQRVRVADALDRAGTPPEHLGDVIAGGGYTFRWVDALFADPPPLSDLTIRWFRSTFEEPALASGTRQPEFAAVTTATGGRLLPLARRAVDLAYRRHLDHYLLEDVIENIEVALDHAGLIPSGARTPPGIAFVDLSGYTSLTEREGDTSAAEIADRFAEIVRRTTLAAGGRVVKLLGDGAMLHFPSAIEAVQGSLDLVARIPEVGLPSAHAGVNAGPVVFRDGDYYGRTVNVAARVADRASADEVLVAEEAVPDPVPDGLRFEPFGDVSLKGLSTAVTLYRVGWTGMSS